MLPKLALGITHFLVNQKVIDAEDVRVYAYGMELVLSTAINFVIIIITALYFKCYMELLLFLAPFFIFRQLIGGYHAVTHFRCSLLMIFMLLSYIALLNYIKMFSSTYLVGFLIAVSFLLNYFLAPAEHPNKPLSTDDVLRLRREANIAFLIFVCIVLFFIAAHRIESATLISVGLFVSSAVMLIGKLVYSKNIKHKQI